MTTVIEIALLIIKVVLAFGLLIVSLAVIGFSIRGVSDLWGIITAPRPLSRSEQLDRALQSWQGTVAHARRSGVYLAENAANRVNQYSTLEQIQWATRELEEQIVERQRRTADFY